LGFGIWSRLRLTLEMIRFSHSLFALPFALSAAIMAWTVPVADSSVAENAFSSPGGSAGVPFRGRDLLGIVLCMVAARSAAMAFNRLADRDLDARNPRTAGRHLPAGRLSAVSVTVFTLASACVFIASTLLFLPNRLPLLAAVPVLLFLLTYSYTKRFTSLAHFWLGAALMMAPIASWVAIRGSVLLHAPADGLPAVWLGLAVLLWVAGFDILYACQDVEFDAGAMLHSVPVRWGVAGALRWAAACHAGMLVVLFTLPRTADWGGPELGLGWIYRAGVAGVTLLLVYEHWLVRPDDLTRVNRAFFHVNAVVSLGLLAVLAIDLWT